MATLETCEQCIHFRQFFIGLNCYNYQRTPHGECTFPTVKPTKTDHPACQNYRKRSISGFLK